MDPGPRTPDPGPCRAAVNAVRFEYVVQRSLAGAMTGAVKHLRSSGRRVWGLGFGVWGFGFRILGVEFEDGNLEFRV